MPDIAPVLPRPLMTAPFSEWTYADAEAALKGLRPVDYGVREAYAVHRDHFQSGKQWVGPGDATSNQNIKNQFAPDDAIGDALRNVANAFREPQVGFSPIQEVPEGQEPPAVVQSRIKEAKALVSWWWDQRKMQELIQGRLRTSAWAGWAGLRLWVPRRFMMQTAEGLRIAEADSFEKAAGYVHVSAPRPSAGGIVVHEDTQDACAVTLGKEIRRENGKDVAIPYAELMYLDPERTDDREADTILRIVYGDEARTGYSIRLGLGGRLLFAQMVSDALLTDPVLRTQRQLNFLSTVITRMAETAAFRERYIKNAKPHGIRVPYEEGDQLGYGAFLDRDDEGRLWQVVPVARTLGAETTTELIGVTRYDKEGNPAGQENPDVVIVDPVDPRPYIDAAESVRRRVLRMCGQGHLAGTSNFEVSGIAYEQARAVFEKDLNARRIAEEGMIRDLITAFLAFVEYITGREGYFTSLLRVTVDQHVDPGPRSPDSVRLDMEAFEKALLSRETAMSKLGVEDIEAEVVRVRQTANYILNVVERLTLHENLTTEGLQELLRLLRLPPNFVQLVEVKEPEPEPLVEPPAN